MRLMAASIYATKNRKIQKFAVYLHGKKKAKYAEIRKTRLSISVLLTVIETCSYYQAILFGLFRKNVQMRT